MKKNLLLFSLVFISLATNAQFSFAPKIGFGATSTDHKLNTTKSTRKTAFYFDAGAEVRYQVVNGFSIESGLGYHYTAHNYETRASLIFITVSSKTNTSLHYINVPLDFVYRKKSGGFYGGAGVNFGLGISGKESVNTSAVISFSAKNDVAFDGKDNTTATGTKKHFMFLNTGLNIKAGYSFKKYFVGVNGCIGLTDLQKESTESFKTTTIGVHAGVVLGCKKKGKK